MIWTLDLKLIASTEKVLVDCVFQLFYLENNYYIQLTIKTIFGKNWLKNISWQIQNIEDFGTIIIHFYYLNCSFSFMEQRVNILIYLT